MLSVRLPHAMTYPLELRSDFSFSLYDLIFFGLRYQPGPMWRLVTDRCTAALVLSLSER